MFEEIFDVFVQEFGAFRPLLQRIKAEYESLLDIYASKLQYIAPLKARLATIKEDATVQLRQIKLVKQKELEEMKHYAAELLQNIQEEKVYSFFLKKRIQIKVILCCRARPKHKRKTSPA